MKSAARIIGWICFVIATVVYVIATGVFGFGFVSAIGDYKAGEPFGFATLLMVFMVFGSIVYAVAAAVALIGLLVANIKRSGKRFFFAPAITLALSVLTWLAFALLGKFI